MICAPPIVLKAVNLYKTTSKTASNTVSSTIFSKILDHPVNVCPTFTGLFGATALFKYCTLCVDRISSPNLKMTSYVLISYIALITISRVIFSNASDHLLNVCPTFVGFTGAIASLKYTIDCVDTVTWSDINVT